MEVRRIRPVSCAHVAVGDRDSPRTGGKNRAGERGRTERHPTNSFSLKEKIEASCGTGLAYHRGESQGGGMQEIDAIIERYGSERRHVISILQDIQARFRYLPQEALAHVAARLHLPLIDVYSLATFYNSFSLVPRGEHIIRVCLGTACHLKGGARLVEALERELGVQEGEVTPDGSFSFETVRCLGACALAPLVVIDEQYQPKMTQRKLTHLLARLRRERSPTEVSP